jgi:hypothetical protein
VLWPPPSSWTVNQMARTVLVCLLASVLLTPAASTANPSGGAPAAAPRLAWVIPAVLREGVSALSRPSGVVRSAVLCSPDLALSPDVACLHTCDASKEACDGKCSMGLNTCLAQCPMLGFACDAYCRAAVVVCRGTCARAHSGCVGQCPERGGRESKIIAPPGAVSQ